MNDHKVSGRFNDMVNGYQFSVSKFIEHFDEEVWTLGNVWRHCDDRHQLHHHVRVHHLLPRPDQHLHRLKVRTA